MRYDALVLCGLLLTSVAFPAGAQEQSSDQEAQSPTAKAEDQLPIVVIGDQKDERRVVVGSRIARKPLFENGSIATSTGTPGFTPGSGMDPAGQYVRTLKRSERVAADERIGKDVACTLLAAKKASENEEWLLVRGMLVPLAQNTELNSIERRAASEVLFLSAQSSGDTQAKIEALELLVASGGLSSTETGKALRSLSSLVSKIGEKAAALEYLSAAIRVDPYDYRALANLAILQRARGDPGAAKIMKRAIAAAEQVGTAVPKAWRLFVNE